MSNVVYAIENMPKPSPKELQRQYDFNEDNNLHTLNITLLVKHFGHPKELEFMKAVHNYQDFLGFAVCHDVKMMLHHKYYLEYQNYIGSE